MDYLKDDKLANIKYKDMGNIAQYLSVSPNGDIRHIEINRNFDKSKGLKHLIISLIKSSNSGAVNIRTFSPQKMKGNKVVHNKNINDLDEIVDKIKKNCDEGKYSIINENIDVNDGGVSGVVLGDIIEFAPKDTPRCVERKGTCLLQKDMGYYILNKVYGFKPDFKFDDNFRVEFSLHPSREGVNKKHTVVWEYELFDNINHEFKVLWPNKFSRFIGDKVFGLLIADYLGLNVPFTTVISREVAPFTFGKKTGLFEKWIRTAPIVKESGKYYSGSKWMDPFLLMQSEEMKAEQPINIASILSQDAVEAKYSGGAIILEKAEYDIIEGVSGKGDEFMLGNKCKNELPDEVVNAVKKEINIFRSYHNLLGDVSVEWVYDGNKVWIVQLNQLNNHGEGNVIVRGQPSYYETYDVDNGLENLRSMIKEIQNKNIGIELVGNVGITSHFGDLLRQFNIPSIIKGS